MFIWTGLAVLLYVLLGFWLAHKFDTEDTQREDTDSKEFHDWCNSLPIQSGPEYEQLTEEHQQRRAHENQQRTRRTKRWNYTRGIAAYLAVTLAILTTAVWIPGSRNAEYDQGWFATHDAFNEGWVDGCDYLMATSDGYVWYHDNKTYDQQWCESLNQITVNRDFFWDFRPHRLPAGSTVEEYERIARNTAANLALRSAFAAQPTLCFADECWDWDRMYSHLLDTSLEYPDYP